MKPKQIWLRDTKKFQFVRCVLFEKTATDFNKEFLDGFHVNGVRVYGFREKIVNVKTKNKNVPRITVDRNYNTRAFGVYNAIMNIHVWGCNFESIRTNSTVLNAISRRIYDGLAYDDAINHKLVINPIKLMKS